jgi:small subunit ribosomal protein S17
MADETPENEQETVQAESTAAPTPAAEPQPVATPKERKQRTKASRTAKAKATLTPEQRQEQRVAERRGKAVARRTERLRTRAKAKAADHASAVTAPREHEQGNQKTRQGVVVSDKADKTITVRIDVARRHRRYSKIVRTSNTLHAHDERNDAHTGDTVLVREARPLSRSKRWRLVGVVERAK